MKFLIKPLLLPIWFLLISCSNDNIDSVPTLLNNTSDEKTCLLNLIEDAKNELSNISVYHVEDVVSIIETLDKFTHFDNSLKLTLFIDRIKEIHNIPFSALTSHLFASSSEYGLELFKYLTLSDPVESVKCLQILSDTESYDLLREILCPILLDHKSNEIVDILTSPHLQKSVTSDIAKFCIIQSLELEWHKAFSIALDFPFERGTKFQIFQYVFSNAGMLNFYEAAFIANSLIDNELKSLAFSSLSKGLLSLNPSTAFDIVINLEIDASSKHSMLLNFLCQISGNDFSDALDLLDNIPDASLKAELLSAMMLSYQPNENPSILLDWISKNPLGLYESRIIQLLIIKVSSSYPELAIEIAKTYLSPSQYIDSFRTVAEAWSKNDPQNALAWANSLCMNFDSEIIDTVKSAVYQEYLKDNIVAATNALLKEESSFLQTEFSQIVIESLLSSDINLACEWISQTNSSMAACTAIDCLCKHILDDIDFDFGEIDFSKFGSRSDIFENSLLEQYIRSSPKEAFRYLYSLNNNQKRNEYLNRTTYQLIDSGPLEFNKFLERIDDINLKTDITLNAVNSLSSIDVISAFEFALSIENPVLLERAVISLIRDNDVDSFILDAKTSGRFSKETITKIEEIVFSARE